MLYKNTKYGKLHIEIIIFQLKEKFEFLVFFVMVSVGKRFSSML